jgi:uncharacterized protein (DUF924 family)
MLAATETAPEALEVIAFWREAGRELWFAGTPAFDELFRERFLELYEEAADGELDGWTVTPAGSLALLILLDQFPRNAFRGTPKMYATDAHAHRIATLMTAWGQDMLIHRDIRMFCYMPFGHSERLADHERGHELIAHLGEPWTVRARRYTETIKRFGRFPHRNAILGRETTSDEEAFLRAGGFSG